MPAPQSMPTPTQWCTNFNQDSWVRGFVTVQIETAVSSVTPDGLLKHVPVNGWLKQRILFECTFFWTFSSWQVFSEASSLVSGYSLSVAMGLPHPHPFLRKDMAEEPSLLSWMGWLPNLKYTVSVHPQNIHSHFFSLLRNGFEARLVGWGGVGRIYPFLSLQLHYLLPRSFSLKPSPPRQSLDEDFKHTPEAVTKVSVTQPSVQACQSLRVSGGVN